MKIATTFLAFISFASSNGQMNPGDSSINSKMYKAQQYLSGVGEQRNEAAAFQFYLQCAELGKPQAMTMVGSMFKNGTGTEVNKEKAVEWFTKAGKTGYANGWYLLGNMYKNVPQNEQDYEKAFIYFSNGAALNDPLCEYAKAYMLYKGFGCNQDYKQASILFAKGAEKGGANSMYFYGLCFRNGYGVEINSESAKYWLTKAAKKGYISAERELSTTYPENSDVNSKEINRALKKRSLSDNKPLNSYQKVEQNLTAGIIDGNYKGYLITYDWSGQYPINTVKLDLYITHAKETLSVFWIEDDSITVPLQATITQKEIIFKETSYSRKDHNSFNKPVLYHFETARLNWMQKDDSVYLSGNLQMFSPERNEPQKPQYIKLVKYTETSSSKKQVNITNEVGIISALNNIKAYPNPFTNVIIVDFELRKGCLIKTQLITIDGKVVYTNNTSIKDAGHFTLPLQSKHIATGTYFLTLQSGKYSKTIKVVKL